MTQQLNYFNIQYALIYITRLMSSVAVLVPLIS